MSRFGVLGGSGTVLQRTPASTLDIYTIVSIFPKKIIEKNPTLDPGYFEIPEGSFDNPSVIHIGSSVSWNRYSPEAEPAEMTFPAILMAHSIVNDYIGSLLGSKLGVATPGVFYLEGRKTSAEVKSQYSAKLLEAKERQDRWYAAMVQAADSLWARSNGNPIAIPDDSRLAAQSLGLKNKPWMQDFNTLAMEACKNCGSLRNPAFPSCPSCRVIVDMELFKKLGLSAPAST